MTDQDEYFNGTISDEDMADCYRMTDVFVSPTRGEGFGLPLIESQACGTPLITTDCSTGPELMRGGWLIPLGEYDWEWFNGTWRPRCAPGAILECLEKAYAKWETGDLSKIGTDASQKIIEEYDWDVVWTKQWRPLLDAIEYLY
jgi:glycosyltransferase involved in cell wall biosynthesis